MVRQIYQWSLEGHGRQNIAYLLNQRGIPNPTRYKSKVIIDTPESEWYRVEDTYEAIIDWATFEAVQRGFKLRTRTDGTGETHPDVRLPHIDTEGKTSIQNLKTFDSQ